MFLCLIVLSEFPACAFMTCICGQIGQCAFFARVFVVRSAFCNTSVELCSALNFGANNNL